VIGVLVAVGAVDLEAELLPMLADTPDVHVVRRCVDVADLISVAASHQADAALVSLALPGLDADVVSRLSELEVAVVGLSEAGTDGDGVTLLRLGVDTVTSRDELPDLPAVVAGVRRPATAESLPTTGAAPVDVGLRRGRLIAVWGPAGSPGRSTVAIGLATESARLGLAALLVDADVYGGTTAQLLGLLDESSGLLAATRAANVGGLTVDTLARHAREVGRGLRVLTGLPRADRWPELRPVLLRSVLDNSRALADLTVVDCGFSLERDEEIVYDTAAPRRNGATLEALERAERVVVVGSADPVGIGRLIRGLDELRTVLPGVAPSVLVNRSRPTLGWGGDDIADMIARASGIEVAAVLPEDPASCDRALVQGRGVTECAPDSPLARALHRVAADLVGAVPAGRRGLRRRTAATAR
jgi:MinD-like ATPase involved in chromosome partitioning or flagellar assembly